MECENSENPHFAPSGRVGGTPNPRKEIAYGLFFYFASQGNLTSLSSLTFLTPIFALIFGHLLLDEVLSLLQSGGVGLTLISIYLINQREQLGRKSQTKIGLEANSISTAEKDLQAVNVRARDSESEVLS